MSMSAPSQTVQKSHFVDLRRTCPNQGVFGVTPTDCLAIAMSSAAGGTVSRRPQSWFIGFPWFPT